MVKYWSVIPKEDLDWLFDMADDGIDLTEISDHTNSKRLKELRKKYG